MNYLKSLIIYLATASFVMAGGTVNLVNQPLSSMTTSDVLPNLMFILDNSGSMASGFTPDWADTSADWLYRDSSYNSQFYNPEIRYIPAMTATGVSMGDQSSWTSVPNDVTDQGAVKGGASNLTQGYAYFYKTTAGEYCKDNSLTSCVSANSATSIYPVAAPVRWCNSVSQSQASTPSDGACQASRVSPFIYLRSPSNKFFITLGTSGSMSISKISINNLDILSSTVSSSSSTSNLVSNIVSKINNCTSTISGSCDISGVYAEAVTSTTIMVSVLNSAYSGVTPVVSKSGSRSLTVSAIFKSNGSISKVTISGSNSSYPKYDGRSDCGSSLCSYSAEMTNFSNWFTYYRTRIQSMKTAASIAFSSVDSRYRVGYITINNYTSTSNFLKIANFDLAQKKLWYSKLYAAVPSGSTPIRGALSNVGRMYAGQWLNGGDDPVQYACQPNFALLTTDGYWNEADSLAVKVKGEAMTDMDATAPRPMYEGPVASSNSLADIAKYYYDTDLRDSAFSNCAGGVCGTPTQYPVQNMTTLTLGLGIDGTVLYSDNYKSQSSGDFARIKNGTLNWPDPSSSDEAKIDDLWHAAVNGGGTYYSAGNPQVLRESLVKGLQEVKAMVASGTAASASSLTPIQGDALQFIASYTTSKWIGNIQALPIDASSLKVNNSAKWCVEDVPSSSCGSGASMQSNPAGGFYCVTPKSTDELCASSNGSLGVGGVSDSCYVSIPSACVGSLKSRISDKSDTRTILVSNGGTLSEFSTSTISSSDKATILTRLKALSQVAQYSSDQKSISDSNLLSYFVGYIRGQSGYNLAMSNPSATLKLFRPRDAVLGDITESKPAYFKKSLLNYADAGYSAFKASQDNKIGVVFSGSNDGMLHAFDASSGKELWSFIPKVVVPNLPYLADAEYPSNHKNYVNGSPTVSDVCVANCTGTNPIWKTVLISGLNGGGREYFALDVTNPSSPSLLWEISSDSVNNLGFSFGNPILTKVNIGGQDKWVALLTSGVNNGNYSAIGVSQTPSGDGRGHLFVVDVATGAILKDISTGEGSALSPSNLMRVGTYAYNPFINNTSLYAYAGDLSGNLWKFDLKLFTATKLFNTSIDSNILPISATPEVGTVNKKPIVLFGTGKYLESADILDKGAQGIFGVVDDGMLKSPSSLATHTLTTGSSIRKVDVVTATSSGWKVILTEGERVVVNPLLLNSVLIIPSMVPSSSSCLGGGFGWINYFDYKSGSSPIVNSGLSSEMVSGIPTGVSVAYSEGKPVISVTDHQSPSPKQLVQKNVASGSAVAGRTKILKQNSNGTYGKRIAIGSVY